MTEWWTVARQRFGDVNHWNRYGESPHVYTARASFEDVDSRGNPHTRGVLNNIVKENTLSKHCFVSPWIRVFVVPLVNTVAMVLSLFALAGSVPVAASLVVGVLWFLVPAIMFANANRRVMWRMWRFSPMPWLQIYLSAVQAYALCDLFQWDWARLIIIVPPMFLGLICLTISDAVYIDEIEKRAALLEAIVSFMWQVALMVGVRYEKFHGMKADGLFRSMGDDVLFMNSSLFLGKGFSVCVCLFSQIIFRIRHPNQMFSLRAHYTVKSDADWAMTAGRWRLYKRESLRRSVSKVRESVTCFVPESEQIF